MSAAAEPERVGVRMPSLRAFAWALCALAGLTLAVAYGAIAQRTGTLWPWNEVVHETGLRTLLHTVLYFEHAARELPLDLVLGIAIGGALLMVRPPSRDEPRPSAAAPAVLSAAAVVLILGGTWATEGAGAIVDNVLQYHTRPSFGLEWGSHWRYHLLSRLALMLAAVGLAGLLCLFSGMATGPAQRAGVRVVLIALALFAAGTVLFAHSPGGLVLPFVDPIYIGHQAREVFTHLLTTLPLAFGIGLLWLRAPAAGAGSLAPATPFLIRSLGAGVSAALIGLYLAAVAVGSDASSQGQTDDVFMLIFPHFFEHSFSFWVTPAVAALTYAVAARRSVGAD